MFEAPITGSNIFTDINGKPLLAIATNVDSEKVAYSFNDENNEWKQVKKFEYGEAFLPLIYQQHLHTLIGIDNFETDTTGLFSLNLDTGSKKTIFNDSENDIEWVHLNENKDTIFGIRTEPGYPKYHFPDINLEEQKTLQYLVSSFPQYRIRITSNTRDLNLFIVSISNDKNPGVWLLYDKSSAKFTSIAKKNSSIDPEKMLAMYPIKYSSRDGKSISGFITLPGNKQKQDLPAVVLVHGGPIGSRNRWEYNNEVQLLAANGYLVLQVNHRGSVGYGKKFKHSGYKHWGDDIQYDIIDGIKYLSEQKLVDPERVCIMGSSFGGYSAVQASIISPKQFKCAIATSGFYDLEALYKDGGVSNKTWGISFLEKTIGTNKSKLQELSPMQNIKKLKTPLLLVHGDKDKMAPFKQAEDFEEELDDLDKVYIWLEMEDEGHGIYNEQNRLKYYTQVIKFLKKYNPTN